MKYRKKPVVVEAIQFTGDNAEELTEFTGKKFWPVDVEDRGDDPEIIAEVMDDLHSTWVGVKLGNWIVKGIKGEFYPCDDEVFKDTYEPHTD